MGYMLKKIERVEKKSWIRWWKKERAEKKKVSSKKRGWASKIAHDLNHLDLERASLRIQPSTHIHTHLHSWSCLYVVFLHGSMLWLYNINILNMPFKFSYRKLHISYSCRALRQQQKILVRTHTQTLQRDLREPHMRSNMSYVLLCKILSKIRSHLRRSDLCLQVRTVPILNRPRWCSSHFKTHRYEYVTWNIFYACIIS